MNILQVIHGYLPQFRGGTELYLRGLTRELRLLDQNVAVFTGTTHSAEEARVEHYDFDGMQVSQLVLAGSYLEHWTRGYSPDAARLFAAELRRIRPDIVHVHHWFRLTRNLLETCYRLGIPAVCTLHDLYATCPSFFRVIEGSFTEAPLDDPLWVEALPRLPWMDDAEVRDEIERFRADFANEMQLAHRIIVPSKAHGALVSRLLELPEERLVVLPHGTITPPPPAELEVLDVPGAEDRIRLGYWGHLFHMKGPHLLLEAVKATGQPERFELHVWGKVVEPQYRERLRLAAEGLDVRWYGSFVPEDIEKVPLDLAVIPSSCSESHSFVLDEAFRLGLPAIVSDRGALAERIAGAGATFRPESAEDLARVLGEIAADPARIGVWRERVPRPVSMSDHARRVLELYAEVVRRRDMSRLVPDLELPRTRTEALARRLRDREKVMFSYLGRIKRETGRGDHYEKVVEEMIAKEHELGARANEAEAELATARRVAAERARLIEALGREIADLRAAFAEPPGVGPRAEPPVPEVSEHVPGLGSIAALVRENQRALERFARRDEDGRGPRLEETLRFLADEILALREAGRRLLAGETEFDLAPSTAPADPVDVPRLGDPATISAENTALVDALRDRERDRRALEDRRLGILGREIEILRDALERLGGDGAVDSGIVLGSMIEHEETKALADLDRLAPFLAPNPAALESYRRQLLAVRRQGERIDTLTRELEERHGADLERLRVEQLKALEGLGGAIEDLRRALLLVHQDDPRVPEEGAAKEEASVAIDVPGLGDLPTIQRVNAEIVADHVEALRALRGDLEEGQRERDTGEQRITELGREAAVLRGERRKLVAGLARELEFLRRALAQAADPGGTFEAPPAVAVESSVHVEGLGSLGEIRAEDERIVAEYLAILGTLRKKWF